VGDHFKMELPGMKLGAWTNQARDRDVGFPLFNTKHWGSKKCGEFLEELRNYQLLNTLLYTI
jgi:hypothetical protein